MTYSTRLGAYRIFQESRVEELVQQLLRADLVVGFNVVNFDYEVLIGLHRLRSPAPLPDARSHGRYREKARRPPGPRRRGQRLDRRGQDRRRSRRHPLVARRPPARHRRVTAAST
ncbi:MAG: hypothetical protein WDN28_28385 [Chthoniobacter sp.]